jgi:hypothetical protein
VSLGSCESEYIARVHCAQEIRYAQQITKEVLGELLGVKEEAVLFGDKMVQSSFLSILMFECGAKEHIDVPWHYLIKGAKRIRVLRRIEGGR